MLATHSNSCIKTGIPPLLSGVGAHATTQSKDRCFGYESKLKIYVLKALKARMKIVSNRRKHERIKTSPSVFLCGLSRDLIA